MHTENLDHCREGIAVPACGHAYIPEDLLRRFGVPVGMEMLCPGRVPSPLWLDESVDHGPLKRDQFPDLYSFAAGSGNMLTDSDWLEQQNRQGTVGAFSSGDGSTTFRIPLLRRVYIRAADPEGSLDVGAYQHDAIRNITGVHEDVYGRFQNASSGAFVADGGRDAAIKSDQVLEEAAYRITFDASRVVPTAEENRPVTIVRLPVIKALW